MTNHVVSSINVRASIVEQINTVPVTNLFDAEDKKRLFNMQALQMDDRKLRKHYEGFKTGTFISGSFSFDRASTFMTFLVGTPSKEWWRKTQSQMEEPRSREDCKAIVMLNSDLKRENDVVIVVGTEPEDDYESRAKYFANLRPLVAGQPFAKPANLDHLLQMLKILIGICPSPITF